MENATKPLSLIFHHAQQVHQIGVALNYDCKTAKDLIRLVTSFEPILSAKIMPIRWFLVFKGALFFTSVPLVDFREEPQGKFSLETIEAHPAFEVKVFPVEDATRSSTFTTTDSIWVESSK